MRQKLYGNRKFVRVQADDLQIKKDTTVNGPVFVFHQFPTLPTTVSVPDSAGIAIHRFIDRYSKIPKKIDGDELVTTDQKIMIAYEGMSEKLRLMRIGNAYEIPDNTAKALGITGLVLGIIGFITAMVSVVYAFDALIKSQSGGSWGFIALAGFLIALAGMLFGVGAFIARGKGLGWRIACMVVCGVAMALALLVMLFFFLIANQ